MRGCYGLLASRDERSFFEASSAVRGAAATDLRRGRGPPPDFGRRAAPVRDPWLSRIVDAGSGLEHRAPAERHLRALRLEGAPAGGARTRRPRGAPRGDP